MQDLDKYNKEIPGDLRRALDALSDNKTRGLVVLLLKEGELSFTQIKEHTETHQQTLTDVLNKLQNGSIVVRDEVVDSGEYQAKYRATSFGKKILDGLFEAYLPARAEKRPPTSSKTEVYDKGNADDLYTDVDISKSRSELVRPEVKEDELDIQIIDEEIFE